VHKINHIQLKKTPVINLNNEIKSLSLGKISEYLI